MKQPDTTTPAEPVTAEVSPPPSRVRAAGYLFEAYGQPRGTVVLTWYRTDVRSATRATLTTEELRAYIQVLQTECARAEQSTVQP
jgi:hypothetical protein